MEGKADLHVHSLASDGALSPGEAVFMASKKLSAVAITDHDTIEGLPEALAAGSRYRIVVIPGIELSCFWHRKECHLLGYNISVNSSDLLALLEKIKNARHERMEKMLMKLNTLNINITWGDLLKAGPRTLWGRPHLARAMVEKKIVTTLQEAFQQYLDEGKAAYVKRWKLTLPEAVEVVKKAGGLPVLAHPGKSNLLSFIKTFKELGVEGVEAYHPDHSFYEVKKIVRMAFKEKIAVLGGSDFHGNNISEAPFVGFIAVKNCSLRGLKFY